MKQIYSGFKKEIDILSVKRKTNAMINGKVNTQSLFLHYVKCRVTHGAAYTTRLMMTINSHPRSPRCTDFRTLHSQCWTNFNVMGRAWVTEDGNSLAQIILEHFLENIASEIYEKVFIMLVECYSHTLREISYSPFHSGLPFEHLHHTRRPCVPKI